MMIINIFEVGDRQREIEGKKGIMEKRWKVCVTGGASYVGSWLVKKLLEKGYTVHTTLRNSKDDSKTGVLRGLPGADDRLVLFEADIYRPDEYASAIQGCVSVFHLATPFHHQPHSQFKDMTEAAVGAVKSIITHCIKSGTVRRLIYTGSVTSASPLKDDDGTAAYKDFIDETCWTPLNHSFPNSHLHKGYTDSKTMAEKELLSYGKKGENGGGAGMEELEVVSLVVGLVGGDTVLSYTPYSVTMLFSHLKEYDESAYQSLKYLEDLIGKIPVAHIDDVCEAHIFCAENPSISTGSRFMVASAYALSADIANYYFRKYPEFNLDKKYLEGPERDIKWSSTKLIDKGFVYKYDKLNMILDDCIKCAKRMGDL